MKEPYGEGLASHTDPESCVAEIRMPTLFIRWEGNTGGRAIASTRWTCEV